MQQRRRSTVFLFALLAGVVIGVVALWFSMTGPQVVGVSAADETSLGDGDEVQQAEFASPNETRHWKARKVVAAVESDYSGDAGLAHLGALKHEGGAEPMGLAAALHTDPIERALDAGTNPFAMLTGSLMKNFATIDGTVSVTGKLLTAKPISHWSDPRCVMRTNAVDDQLLVTKGKLANAVVIAEPINASEVRLKGMTRSQRLSLWGFGPHSSREPDLVISGCRFAPRVLAVTPDASIEITVEDDSAFALELRGADTVWSKLLDGRGTTWRAPALGSAGEFRLRDAKHEWMKGLVVSTWYPAAVTDRTGNFRLALRPGDYKLRVLHETLPELSRIIKVEGDATHDFSLTLESRDVASRK